MEKMKEGDQVNRTKERERDRDRERSLTDVGVERSKLYLYHLITNSLLCLSNQCTAVV